MKCTHGYFVDDVVVEDNRPDFYCETGKCSECKTEMFRGADLGIDGSIVYEEWKECD